MNIITFQNNSPGPDPLRVQSRLTTIIREDLVFFNRAPDRRATIGATSRFAEGSSRINREPFEASSVSAPSAFLISEELRANDSVSFGPHEILRLAGYSVTEARQMGRAGLRLEPGSLT